MSALITAVENLVVLSVGNRLKVVEFRNGQKYSELELRIPSDNDANEVASDESREAEVTDRELTSIHISRCQSYILVTTSDKRLIVFRRESLNVENLEVNEWVVYSTRKTPRKCVQTALTSQKPPTALVADRAGDVYEYYLNETNTAPRLLMGRLSMLLDMTLTPSNEFLIVCDRDEKIQVSSYPECYNIVSFCLGHQQSVTSIALLDQFKDRLVSVGGDGQLKLWNIRTGCCIASYDCWADAENQKCLEPFSQFSSSHANGKKTYLPLKKVLSRGSFVVAVYTRVPYIHILRCDEGESLRSIGGVYTEQPVWSATLDRNSRLWVLTPMLQMYNLTDCGSHGKLEAEDVTTRCFEDLLKSLEGRKEQDNNLEVFYKHWFDNVDQYLQRKKCREEGKQLKRKRCQQ